MTNNVGKYVDCPNGGKCGSKTHKVGSESYFTCLRAGMKAKGLDPKDLRRPRRALTVDHGHQGDLDPRTAGLALATTYAEARNYLGPEDDDEVRLARARARRSLLAAGRSIFGGIPFTENTRVRNFVIALDAVELDTDDTYPQGGTVAERALADLMGKELAGHQAQAQRVSYDSLNVGDVIYRSDAGNTETWVVTKEWNERRPVVGIHRVYPTLDVVNTSFICSAHGETLAYRP